MNDQKKNTPAKKTRLKTGFTTGAAAAAAVKGALYLLLENRVRKSVTVNFLDGGCRDIEIQKCSYENDKAVCIVIKDAGDDPDVTNRAEIGVMVFTGKSEDPFLTITGGKGVGKVTKPGLEIPPGEPAITPGPRKMIANSVEEVFSDLGLPAQPLHVEVFVPEGETLAKKTLNFRLGIVGGISILGTTGVVRPMSHEAYIATIKSSMSVAKATGVQRIFLTTGRRSEKHAQRHWANDKEESFIQIGDFFKMSLETASKMNFNEVVICAFFGKAVKMAYGIPHTHAAKSDMCMERLSEWTVEITGNTAFAKEIKSANTARQAFFLLEDKYPDVINRVGAEMIRSAKSFTVKDIEIRSVILDYEGVIIFDSGRREEG